MRCEAQDGPCSSATQAACNEAARPNPTGEIGELISCHILRLLPAAFTHYAAQAVRGKATPSGHPGSAAWPGVAATKPQIPSSPARHPRRVRIALCPRRAACSRAFEKGTPWHRGASRHARCRRGVFGPTGSAGRTGRAMASSTPGRGTGPPGRLGARL